MTERFDNADELIKMSMGGSSSSKQQCKISMLWNWYTIDTCFISRSWRNDTRGKFAGSCIGCFLLVFVAQWLNRVSRQFDIELAERRKIKTLAQMSSKYSGDMGGSSSSLSKEETAELSNLLQESDIKTSFKALLATMSHTWYVRRTRAASSALPNCCVAEPFDVYPTILDHILRALIFTLQWGLSYIIMLLFMYYNGYIIISCLLGALFGRLFFNFEPLVSYGGANSGVSLNHDKEENDRKCCM
ncbi:LAMI_0A01816g1_1 [Lachancea mirantina]|uniref:Copper transport protein n=1 Tax=Lachancea mirantina TaxID=1230905 RepID=A0A1G4IML5_9SACH|nr:LAMI_0A01816g1_1 [Lachancea mirantina]